MKVYDLIILGAGPAGITAAIYASRAKLDTLWIDRRFDAGGQIVDTYEIDNYPGMPGISGIDLAEAMAAHAEKLGMAPTRDNIRSIEILEDEKILRSKKKEYRARNVIIAGGAKHRMLEIPGEEEYAGMGVSYCATCDGAFFKDKVTAVIGGGNTAVEDALFLSRVCKKVYLIYRKEHLRADRVLTDKLAACENVEILWNRIPVEIKGDEAVRSMTIKSTVEAAEEILSVDGVFIAVGMQPDTQAFEGILKLDENGYIVAGEDCSTSVKGIFAAGDIRTKKLRQVVTAVSDGANAVRSVQELL